MRQKLGGTERKGICHILFSDFMMRCTALTVLLLKGFWVHRLDITA